MEPSSREEGRIIERFWQLQCAKTASNFDVNKLSTFHKLAWSNALRGAIVRHRQSTAFEF